MAAPAGYFDYPHRGPGLDHNLFDMRYLKHAPPVQWPGGKSVALFVTIGLDWFPLDMPAKPFVPTGGLARAYPDIWNYTTRDYGNRVGIYRILEVCAALGVRTTAFVQGEIARRYPRLVRDVMADGHEIAAGGLDMGHLHAGALDAEVERGYIAATLEALAKVTGNRARGWHSPAFAQTQRTPELLAEAELDYGGDWVNDDMPFTMRTAAGPLVAMPYQFERSDIRILFEQNQSIEQFERQIIAAFEVLKAESSPASGRIMSLSLSPWVIGQPYRIRGLARLLSTMMADPAVWPATGSEIVAALQLPGHSTPSEAAE
jgi:peptidoglycan/xylan/chitin deacetylase (PgdA/CDA1 family)